LVLGHVEIPRKAMDEAGGFSAGRTFVHILSYLIHANPIQCYACFFIALLRRSQMLNLGLL
jgi:hypothetical protein